jgi:hypothetical protein
MGLNSNTAYAAAPLGPPVVRPPLLAFLLKHMPKGVLAHKRALAAGSGTGPRGRKSVATSAVTDVDSTRGYGFHGPCKK